MRILLLGGVHRAQIRGGVVAIHGLVRALRDRGHEVTLVHAALPQNRASIDGVRIEYHSTEKRSLFPLLFALRRLGQYDVVHAFNESGAYLALRRRLWGFPLVVQVQGSTIRHEGFWKSNWRWRYIGLSVRNAPVVVTATRWLADALVGRYGFERANVRVIPEGVGEHWFGAETGRVSTSGSVRVVLINMRGVDVALRAFAKACRGTATVLDLYGVEQEPEQNRRLATELGIAEQVRFQGFVPNPMLPQQLAGADLMLYPTGSENFSQVLAEGAAIGLPVITTNVTGNPEVVLNGVTGLLCAYDVDAFADALTTLVKQPELRGRLGEAARKRASESWRWSRIATKFEDEVYAPLTKAASDR
jgi:glycosyltransferase involved in cell wall biosynthesis